MSRDDDERIEEARRIMSNPENVLSLEEMRQQRASKQASPQAGRSRFFVASDLEGKPVPPRHWLVDALIPSGTVTLLSGDGGTGKSLIALQLAAACAMGKPWLGREITHGPALFISAEDDQDELHRRLADVVEAEDADLASLDRLALRSLAGEDALLTALDARTGIQRATQLFREIEAYIYDQQPVLVVLDTLADLFPGNENDRAQARQFIGLLRGLAIRHECAVVVLAHPSLSGLQSGTGTSGSTGWNNSVRSRLYLHRVFQGDDEPNPDARVLETMKSNYGPTGAEIALTWRDGVFVAEAQDTGLDRMARGSKAERVFLKLLRMLTEQGRHVNANSGTRYAPSVFAMEDDAEGVTRDAFRKAMSRLFAQGTIRNAEIIRGRKPVNVIQEVV